MKHSKTGTNLPKPKKRSEIIAQQTKTVEKLNIISFAKVHPKTATELSKPMKQPEIISQLSKTVKMKNCTESKVTDWKQKLKIIRKYDNLPQNYSKFY